MRKMPQGTLGEKGKEFPAYGGHQLMSKKKFYASQYSAIDS